MTQYNTWNEKRSNSQNQKPETGLEGTFIKVIGDYDDETNFPHELLLTNAQVLKYGKALANKSSANTKLLKTQLSKQKKPLLGRLLGPLLKTCLSLMKNVLKLLAKSDFILLGLTPAASATDAAIQNKFFSYGLITLIIFN